MTTTDYAADITLPDSQSENPPGDAQQRPPDVASKPLKGVVFGFAATITVGLALASWYVGVRIMSADEIVPAITTASAPVNSTPAPPPLAPPAVTEDSMAEAFWYTVPPTVVYLQATSLGPQQDAGFVKSLRAKGFNAQVQTRSQTQDQDNARILIGPFSTHVEMEQAKRKLQSSGVLAIESVD
jgi:cell division protein FtsN